MLAYSFHTISNMIVVFINSFIVHQVGFRPRQPFPVSVEPFLVSGKHVLVSGNSSLLRAGSTAPQLRQQLRNCECVPQIEPQIQVCIGYYRYLTLCRREYSKSI